MDKTKIYECLAEICEKDIAEIQNLDEKIFLSEIGLDSLRFLRFIVSVEERFGIEVNDSDIVASKFQTIEDIFSTLSKYFVKDLSYKKVLILDCDNVLWKGTAGETETIIDEDVRQFQELLIDLQQKGLLLCLCSKNTLEAVEKMFKNSEMLLTDTHIVSAHFGCLNKAESIAAISCELHLPIDTFLFLDDSDFEIDYVCSNLPQISSIKVDYDTMVFMSQLREMFSNVVFSNDLDRTQMYKDQKEREKVKNDFTDIDEYNRCIHTKVMCDLASREQIPRLVELSQRTHQFNLSNLHYTTEQLESRFSDYRYQILYLSASDKFGDMGIVGMAVINKNLIESFMISCRVLGRNFEYVLLDKIKSFVDHSVLRGIYVLNDMNKKHAKFYEQNKVLLWRA